MHLTHAEEQTYLKYAELALPRHTSYPTVPQWSTTWSPADFQAALDSLGRSSQPLSLYVHVPFCRQLCFYCGCTREIITDGQRAAKDPAEDFLAGIALEARRLALELGVRVVHEVHLGGGTPTFLTPGQLARLFEILVQNFILAPNSELSVEVDPRTCSPQHLRTLRGLGFNRLSFGIQDFDPRVQAAIGRIQTFDTVRAVVDRARNLGFQSLNFDLIYGLPWQTEDSLTTTLEQVAQLDPDRIAFFRLAVLPDLFKWQRTLTRSDLPVGLASLRLMQLAVRHFTAVGYEFIGLDHFVKPHDPLARAARQGDLTRTFQGMAAGRERATIALGPSGISQAEGFFSQSDKTTKAWRAAVSAGLSATRGVQLSADDRVRREVLRDLYANGRVDYTSFRRLHRTDFATYFAREMPSLHSLSEAGLVTLRADGLALTPTLGRLLVRVVASALDRYLPEGGWSTGVQPGQAASAAG